MTASPSPKLTEAPPELTRTAIYPMRTQRRPLRVTYAVAPDAFAVAALADALACTVADAVGAALADSLADDSVGLAGAVPVKLHAGTALTHGAPPVLTPILVLE